MIKTRKSVTSSSFSHAMNRETALCYLVILSERPCILLFGIQFILVGASTRQLFFSVPEARVLSTALICARRCCSRLTIGAGLVPNFLAANDWLAR